LTKSRRRPARRTAKSTASRRTSARKTARKSARKPASGGRKVIRLKPLYAQLGRTIEQLEKLPPSDRVKFAIERLTQCRAEFADMCGPTMDIPAAGMPLG
jgi:hypothetical protein